MSSACAAVTESPIGWEIDVPHGGDPHAAGALAGATPRPASTRRARLSQPRLARHHRERLQPHPRARRPSPRRRPRPRPLRPKRRPRSTKRRPRRRRRASRLASGTATSLASPAPSSASRNPFERVSRGRVGARVRGRSGVLSSARRGERCDTRERGDPLHELHRGECRRSRVDVKRPLEDAFLPRHPWKIALASSAQVLQGQRRRLHSCERAQRRPPRVNAARTRGLNVATPVRITRTDAVTLFTSTLSPRNRSRLLSAGVALAASIACLAPSTADAQTTAAQPELGAEEARLVSVHGAVEVLGADTHAAREGERLSRGLRLRAPAATPPPRSPFRTARSSRSTRARSSPCSPRRRRRRRGRRPDHDDARARLGARAGLVVGAARDARPHRHAGRHRVDRSLPTR